MRHELTLMAVYIKQKAKTLQKSELPNWAVGQLEKVTLRDKSIESPR